MSAGSDRATPWRPQELDAFLDHLALGLGRPGRAGCLREYCLRVLAGMGFHSPLAAADDPRRASARHQAQHHFIAKADWPDHKVRHRTWTWVGTRLDAVPGTAWLVEDVEIPKRGRHSVGVARQYGATPGKHGNCQIAVAVTLARRSDSLPLACRLHLPDEWIRDRARCRQAGVPADVGASTWAGIALEQLADLVGHGFTRRPVFAGPRYGQDPAFRHGLHALGLQYLVALPAATLVRSAGAPQSAGSVARSLPGTAWHVVPAERLDEGTGSQQFAATRVTPIDSGGALTPPHECWLVIARPAAGEPGFAHELCNLPPTASLQELVALHRQRRRLTSHRSTTAHKLQLIHYAGRGWRGFHHHVALALAMLAFVTTERWDVAAVERPCAGSPRRAAPGDAPGRRRDVVQSSVAGTS